ncbi:MAG: CapA family protein [Nitrososphaeria archaeon]
MPKWENLVRSIRGNESIFTKVSKRLNEADIAFCQPEILLSDKSPFSLPQARRADYVRTKTAYELKRAGFDVVSFASNHCMDWGVEILTQ